MNHPPVPSGTIVFTKPSTAGKERSTAPAPSKATKCSARADAGSTALGTQGKAKSPGRQSQVGKRQEPPEPSCETCWPAFAGRTLTAPHALAARPPNPVPEPRRRERGHARGGEVAAAPGLVDSTGAGSRRRAL